MEIIVTASTRGSYEEKRKEAVAPNNQCDIVRGTSYLVDIFVFLGA